MKRFWSVFLTLLLALSLFGCAKQETVYTVNRNGIDFQIDSVQKTISDGEHTYRYEFSGNYNDFHVTITYPDDSSYWYNQSEGVGNGGWSDDYVAGKYVSADTLIEAVREKAPQNGNPGRMIGAVVLIALGLFDIIVPKVAWFLSYGWWYKNAEPSDAALILARVGGAIAMVVGFLLIFS